jgi:thiol-disulfide isomerase/thioredoxin
MKTLSIARSASALRIVASVVFAVVAGTASSAIAPSTPAPDFSLHAMSGPNMRLQDQRGRVVMVNFWATWCAPCRQEMPQLNRLYQKYRSSGFVLLGVNVDDVLLDADKRVSKLYDLNTMPSTVIIDRDGKVRYVHRGYLAGYEDNYEKQIRELLK